MKKLLFLSAGLAAAWALVHFGAQSERLENSGPKPSERGSETMSGPMALPSRRPPAQRARTIEASIPIQQIIASCELDTLEERWSEIVTSAKQNGALNQLPSTIQYMEDRDMASHLVDRFSFEDENLALAALLGGINHRDALVRDLSLINAEDKFGRSFETPEELRAWLRSKLGEGH
jgi:hypothetical protein